MTSIDKNSVVLRHHEAAFREVDGSAVIVMPRQAKVVTLNPVGSHVWGALDGRTVEAIAVSVTEVFEVELDAALADTLAFLRELDEKGLVTVEGR